MIHFSGERTLSLHSLHDDLEQFHNGSPSTDWLLHALATVLMTCYAGSELVFHELYDLILGFVDQLLALDLSGLACSLSRLLATAHKLSVNVLSNVLFAAGSCLELNWTEHGSATMYVFKDSGACLFGCARLSHSGSCCGPPTVSGIGVSWVSLPGPTDVP